MNTLTIHYPAEILWALQQDPDEFAHEAQLLLALKLYETGKLSSGLAAQMAGIPRVTFIYLLGQYNLSSFGETPEELEKDYRHAQQAVRRAGDSE
jgi:predicted HTH domain antitoxin